MSNDKVNYKDLNWQGKPLVELTRKELLEACAYMFELYLEDKRAFEEMSSLVELKPK